MSEPTITIPRELFERLTEAAIELCGANAWMEAELHPRYQKRWEAMNALQKESVALRDREDTNKLSQYLKTTEELIRSYSMPECFDVTVSRERMEVIVKNLHDVLEKTTATEFCLIVSREKFAIQPFLPRTEIVLEKEKKA